MRVSGSAIGLLAVIVPAIWPAPAGAQTQQQTDWCVNKANSFSPDLRINGCTAAIQSGKNLAWAFNNRCSAYNHKKENDHAIADCDQAISTVQSPITTRS
jgi:hypothetical protein